MGSEPHDPAGADGDADPEPNPDPDPDSNPDPEVEVEADGEAGEEEVDTSHLDGAADGCGCTEMWEHLADQRGE